MKFLTVACFVVFSLVLLHEASADCKIDGVPKPVKEGGSYKPPGECFEYRCNNGDYHIEQCLMLELRQEEWCHVTDEDPSKPFPACCSKKVCP